MRSQERHISSESAATRALRAVEVQRQKRLEGMNEECQAQRGRLFDLLDQLAPEIFAAVESAAHENKRDLGLITIRGFAVACDGIFGRGFGHLDVSMLNDWLHKRDLSHVFFATAPADLNW